MEWSDLQVQRYISIQKTTGLIIIAFFVTDRVICNIVSKLSNTSNLREQLENLIIWLNRMEDLVPNDSFTSSIYFD